MSDGEFVGQDDALVTVIDPTASATVERRITVGTDDVEERISNGVMTVEGSDLELGFDGARAQLVGLRFPDRAIPPGLNVRAAWIQFMADETGASAASPAPRLIGPATVRRAWRSRRNVSTSAWCATGSRRRARRRRR